MKTPKRYLLLSDHSVTQIVNQFYTEKEMILEPTIVGILRNLVKLTNGDYELLYVHMEAQKEILEYAAEVFVSNGLSEDSKVFTDCLQELEIIQYILDNYTSETKPEFK